MSSELAVALVSHLFTTHVRELSSILFRAALESRGDVVELTEGARQLLGLAGEQLAGGRAPARRHGRRSPRRSSGTGALARRSGVSSGSRTATC